jgi:hypothetical protein
LKRDRSKGGMDSQSTKGEGDATLLIPQEVDNTQKNKYADAQSHEEIGTKSSKDAPLQSLGIDDIGKSLIDLAKKNSMLDSSPINSKSIDLFRSIHELRPCMKSLNNGEVM